MYSNYKYREYQRGIEVPLAWGSGTDSGHRGRRFQQTATWSNVYAVQRNNYNTRDAHTLALGGNLKYASPTICASRWTPAIRRPSATTMPMKPTPAPATTIRARPTR
jgi:hypothetical protein